MESEGVANVRAPAGERGRDRAASLRASVHELWSAMENPVLGREFRSRMRGARSYIITGAYTLVVMTFVMAAYWSLTSRYEVGTVSQGAANQIAAQAGRAIWTWGCLAQAVLLALIVPAFTCGSITLERERD